MKDNAIDWMKTDRIWDTLPTNQVIFSVYGWGGSQIVRDDVTHFPVEAFTQNNGQESVLNNAFF